jgi:hypothetical protein
VANFESSYHAILQRPALAKFMSVPHYVYLLLKIPGNHGVLTFHGDLKKSYDYDQEAIEYVSTTLSFQILQEKYLQLCSNSPIRAWRS